MSRQALALIIDDNEKNVGVLRRLLTRDGVETVQIPLPLDLALTLGHLEQADLLFLDLVMPDMDGFEILHAIRSSSPARRARVVAYTVHAHLINDARTQGFDSFIAKPIDPDRFPDQLSRLLRGQAVWEAR